MASTYGNMTTEELQRMQQGLMNRRDELKEDMRAIQAILDERAALEAARHKYAAMSDPERAALHQIISDAGGIESGEQVGRP